MAISEKERDMALALAERIKRLPGWYDVMVDAYERDTDGPLTWPPHWREVFVLTRFFARMVRP